MKYTENKIVSTASDLHELVSRFDKRLEYQVFVGFCDSLYAVIDAYEDEEHIYIQSRESQGAGSEWSLEDLDEIIKNYPNDFKLFCDPAEDIDPSLDLQMESECHIISLAIDDVCKIAVLIAEYCS